MGAVDAGVAAGNKRTVKGRQTSDGDEAVIKHTVLKKREGELVELFNKAAEASEALADALKKTAEDSGYNTATVRKKIAALANDTVDAERKKAAQLALIFEVDDVAEAARDTDD